MRSRRVSQSFTITVFCFLALLMAGCARGIIGSFHEVFQAPTAQLKASLTSLSLGQSATLSWSSSNASSAQIDHGIGPVQTSGSLTVSPQQTTTYTITVTGAGGTASAQITILVSAPPPVPTVSLSDSPVAITAGQSAMLTWSSSNASSAQIDNGIGSVQTSGSLAVSPQ